LNASVLAFPCRAKGSKPWTNDELAELYRVVDILARAGLVVETDLGLSDEGDPWFVFCRADTGDVIAHFARIDGQFVAASVAVDKTYKGANFRQIVDKMVESQPLLLPPPRPGTRLFLHPAVILTAFVATALAFSERAHAADHMQAVDAKLDPTSGGHEHASAKHGKLAWLDSLPSWIKSFSSDGKSLTTHDPAGSAVGEGVTLASLIAIAMSAVQPVLDTLAVSDSLLAGGISGLDQMDRTQSAASVFSAANLPMIDVSAVPVGDSVAVDRHAGEQAATAIKKVVFDNGTDFQKLGADSGHLLSVQVGSANAVHKLPAATDDMPHQAMQSPFIVEAQQNVTYSVAASSPKAVAAAAVQPISAVSDTSAPVVINIKDVTPQALQLLNIHIDGQNAAAGEASAPSMVLHLDTSAASGVAAHQSGGLAVASSVPLVSPATIPPSPVTGSPEAATAPVGATSTPPQMDFIQPHSQSSALTNAIVEMSTSDGVTVLAAINSFAISGQHNITGNLQGASLLQQALTPFASPNKPLTLVVFESTALSTMIFSYSPGVVFVDERFLAADHALSNPGGNLILDLASGGSVTLVGVATVEHVVA